MKTSGNRLGRANTVIASIVRHRSILGPRDLADVRSIGLGRDTNSEGRWLLGCFNSSWRTNLVAWLLNDQQDQSIVCAFVLRFQRSASTNAGKNR